MHVSFKRRFAHADQLVFAKLSGDTNPMHMDAVAARRTQAGVPVVHGIHALLWVLDSLAAAGVPLAGLHHLRVQFTKFVPVGQDCDIEIRQQDASGARVSVLTAGLPAITVMLKLGARQPAAPNAGAATAGDAMPHDATARALELTDMAQSHGWLTAPVPDAALAAAFPHAAAALSARRLSGLAQTSRLVGMVCPGLHSIYAGLTIELNEPEPGPPGIAFRATKADERFRLVDLSIAGDGLAGKISAFARHAPVPPPSMAALARRVTRGEFTGTTALVIGGSRGLGAATAMLLAAGGARVAITYARGRQDAADVQAAIEAACGTGACAMLAYDASQPAAPQLATLADAPTQLYYFATPQIWQPKQDAFVAQAYHGFSRFYVDAFHECCQTVQATCKTVFYPSSEAVTARPAGMAEYAMAKAAGEVLCTEMQERGGWHVVQSRLPRTLTDQTATVVPAESAGAVETMLPFLRAMHAG